MSIMSRNRALAGYLASTRSSEDPDLRRNDDDETHLDYDYNRVSMLGSVRQNGSKYPIWEQQIQKVLGIPSSPEPLFSTSIFRQAPSALDNAPFYGDNKQYVSILAAAVVNVPFLKAMNVVVPPAEMSKPGVARKIYTYAIYKAFKDANLAEALSSAGTLSQSQAAPIFLKFPNLRVINVRKQGQNIIKTSHEIARPNKLPNNISFVIDGDSADKAESELAKNVSQVDQILRNAGFYNAPLTQNAADQIYAQIVGLLGVDNVGIRIYNKNAPNGLLASNQTIKVNVTPAKTTSQRITSSPQKNVPFNSEPSTPSTGVSNAEPAPEPAPAPAPEPAPAPVENKKSFFSSTAGMVTIGVGVLAIGGAAFYFMSKNKT